jgi:hypothetical protein
MLECALSTAGGSHVFCDTDSMAIVTDYSATEADPAFRAFSDRPDALKLHEIDRIVQALRRAMPLRLRRQHPQSRRRELRPRVTPTHAAVRMERLTAAAEILDTDGTIDEV